jgi:hypothetical protein
MPPISLRIERRPLQVAGLSLLRLVRTLRCWQRPGGSSQRCGRPSEAGQLSGVAVGLGHGAGPSSCHHGRLCVERWKGAQIAQSTVMSCRPSVSLVADRHARPVGQVYPRGGQERATRDEGLGAWNVCGIKCLCVSFDLEMPELPVAKFCAVVTNLLLRALAEWSTTGSKHHPRSDGSWGISGRRAGRFSDWGLAGT